MRLDEARDSVKIISGRVMQLSEEVALHEQHLKGAKEGLRSMQNLLELAKLIVTHLEIAATLEGCTR